MTDSLVAAEPLETGWGPDVPIGDTVVRRR